MMPGHVESKLEEENYTDQKKVFDFSESVAIGIEANEVAGIYEDDVKKLPEDTPTEKFGIFDIFRFADATDKACMAFALVMTALSGANQARK
jgi:hypothetical protein